MRTYKRDWARKNYESLAVRRESNKKTEFDAEYIQMCLGNGSRFVDHMGYARIYAPFHPAAAKSNRHVAEHRLVMELKLGRYLVKGEQVHHLRHWEKSNNSIENLELWTHSQPSGSRVENIVEHAVQALSLHAPHLLRETAE